MKFPPPRGPLFTLRLDRAGYEALGDWLTQQLRYADPARLDVDTAASFCVFAAEWWRRNHEQGPWKWLGIQQALGIERVRQLDLRTWTERGLRQLGRKPVQVGGATLYLVSLATEGGFPIKMVKRKGTYLHVLFSKLFEHLERTSNRVPTADEVAMLAEQRAAYLPRSLRQQPLFHLVGLLVARIWPLIQEVSGEKRPLAWLDDHRPGWRDDLPIELEDEDARAFLERLIVEATGTLTKSAGFEIGCHLAQDPDTSAWRLMRSFSAPERLPEEVARELLGDHAGAPAISIRMIGAQGEAVAAVLRSHQADYFTEIVPGARLRDDDGSVEIELLSRSLPASRVSVTGGMALGPLPWTFRRRHDRWELTATASCRIGDDVVLVAIPDGATVTPADATTEVGELDGLERRLVEVRGRVEVRTAPDEIVEIACGAEEVETTPRFTWSGGRHPDLGARRPVFRGWPTLFEEQTHGRRRPVDFEVKGPAGWGRSGTAFGDVLARRKDKDGRLVFLQWVQVVPDDLSVKLDVDLSRGRVTVESAYLLDAGIPSASGIRVDRQRLSRGVALDVVLDGDERPAIVDLLLHFGARPVNAQIASPVKLREILGRDGRPVPEGQALHVGEIGGVTIQVTEPRRDRHYVEASLVRAPVRRTFRVPATGEHTSTLDLRAIQDEIRALLGQSLDLDAEVELMLFTPGADWPRRSLRVRRYDWRPEPDKENGDVVLPDSLPVDDTVVEARPFDAILEKVQLPRVRTPRLPGARWQFGPSERTPGAWLVTVRDSVWFRARPMLWTVRGAPPATGLAGALQVGHPEKRRQDIRAALDLLASDLDHPDWRVLDELLEACADLPAASFDGIVQLLEHPVLPLVLLRLTWREPQLRLRICESLGMLPACWMLVPRVYWFAAFDTLHRGEEDPELALESVLEAVALLRPVVDVDGHAFRWCEERGLRAPPSLGEDCRMARLPEGRFAALQSRADLVAMLRHRHLLVEQWPVPDIPEPPAALRVEHASSHHHVDRIAQAPASAVHFALTSRAMPPIDLARAFKDAHDFDPTYFRDCWPRTLAVGLALEHH